MPTRQSTFWTVLPLLFLGLLIVGGSLIVYSIFFEPYFLTQETIYLPAPSPAWKNVTIVFLTDLHISSYGSHEKHVIQRVWELNPEYLLFGGDFVSMNDNHTSGLAQFLEELPPVPRYGVYGNHDHLFPHPSSLSTVLSEGAVTILNNQHVSLCRTGECITLCGVNDPYLHRADVKKVLECTPSHHCTLLIAHTPDVVFDGAGHADLILSGHTHGGQINIPFLRVLWLRSSLYDRFCSGEFMINGTRLYVSRGIGTMIPIRFLAPPEITVIRFV